MDAAQATFPFDQTVPRAQRSRLGRIVDRFKAFKALADEHGVLIPAPVAAKLLDVSLQRIHQLKDAGIVASVKFEGHAYIIESSLWDYAKSDRGSGFRYKDVSLSQCIDLAKEQQKKTS